MMGQQPPDQNALFYDFCLENYVPQDHRLRQIDPFPDLSDLRAHVSPYYSHTGRPSVDPEAMIRMLIVGYCYGIRSERRLCSVTQASAPVRKISPTDPAASYTAAPGGPAFYAYSTNYLADTKHGIIMDVEPTTANRAQEVESTRTTIERVERRFGITPERLIGDTAYGTAAMLG
jgi:hypothetical protein